MRGSASVVGATALALAALAPLTASAYCRTASCPGNITGTQCTPADPEDCEGGHALFWGKPCVTYSIQEGASDQVTLAATEQVFAKAFEAWLTAPCAGGGSPRMEVTYMGPVPCDLHEYNQEKANANIFTYRDDGWPHQGGGSTLALTTVTYNLDTGEIYDADMELNSAIAQFTVSDTGAVYDLQSIATHEVGHFLGLAHTTVEGATMESDYMPGSLTLRDLDADDIAGICAIYPPGDVGTCDPTPRHGYSPDCAADQPEDEVVDQGCTCATTSSGRGAGSAAIVALGLGALALARRRPRS
jgi:MYXO-CTERM domain-containing protein